MRGTPFLFEGKLLSLQQLSFFCLWTGRYICKGFALLVACTIFVYAVRYNYYADV